MVIKLLLGSDSLTFWRFIGLACRKMGIGVVCSFGEINRGNLLFVLQETKDFIWREDMVGA